jgi:hypothetical protein
MKYLLPFFTERTGNGGQIDIKITMASCEIDVRYSDSKNKGV